MPAREDLARRVPAEATHLIDSTYRILRLYALSGARNPKALRRWKDSQSDPEIKGSGFATSTAQQIAKELFPDEQEADPVVRDSDPEIEAAPTQEGGEGEDDPEPRNVARVDASALSLFQQWQKQIKDERAEAASEARAQEREIAKAAIEAEKKAAIASIEAEKRDSLTQAKLQRAHMRLYATIAIIVALGGGVVIGVAWSRHSVVQDAPMTQGGIPAAVATQPQPHPVEKPAVSEEKTKPVEAIRPETAPSATAGSVKSTDNNAKNVDDSHATKSADVDKPAP